MNQLERFKEIIATYNKHGWRLKRVLMCEQSRVETSGPEADEVFENIPVQEAPVDALWFARPSHAGREAWELRLLGDMPYALFETFEADEMEEDREEVRREMEARLRDYSTAGRKSRES